MTESHSTRRDAIHVGRWDQVSSRAGHQVGAVLVGHEEQYVGLVVQGCVPLSGARHLMQPQVAGDGHLS
jgi:hypothetical protein